MINQILNGDCLELMKEIPDHSIDMIATDLPFGLTNRNDWDKEIDLNALWLQYKRVIKENGCVALNSIQPFTTKLINSNPEWFKLDYIWVKNKKTGFLNSSKRPLVQHESILLFYNKQPTYNPQKTTGHKPVNSYTKNNDGLTYGKTKKGFRGGGSVERYPSSVLTAFSVVNNDNPDKIHSSQKPISLVEYFIKTYSNEGGIVLDSCSGSGTTAIAALKNNRQFICIEKDPQIWQRSVERLEKFKKEKV